MCNTYVIRPKLGAQGLAQRVSEATVCLKSELVHKSDPGVVVRADGRVDLMRWGFPGKLDGCVSPILLQLQIRNSNSNFPK